MATVKLSGIYKVYEGGVRAVNDFNLDIPDKEFVVFVGPSGCGKSTTLRMIAGLEDITQGKLYIDGEVVNDVDSKNRDIAMVFQSYALYPHMTVYQNMAFGLKLRHTPKEIIDEKVKKAAEILEISELLSRKPKALSGGQRQRVALGRAIVREPKVFLLDEPLSNLDAKLRVQMRSEITKLHRKLATTFIYVTHDQTEAMTMGTRIVVMKDGFIQQVDSPIALFEDPCNLFVATFLGSPQMNILDASLVLEDGVLKANIKDATKCGKLVFPDIKRKELANDSYIGKEVKIGIRPESISLDDKGPIKARIDTVEQLGDETILYCKIDGINNNLVVKMPFKGHIDRDQDISLSFDMKQIHVFDVKTTKSIMGICSDNNFRCSVSNECLKIGSEKFDLPEYFKDRILPFQYGKDITMSIHVDHISIEPIENALKMPIHIEFEDQKTDYIAAYFKVKGLDEHFVLKLANGIKEKPSYIYLPYDKCLFLDEDGEVVISREKVYPNEVNGYATVQGDKTIVKALGKSYVVATKPSYENGPCKVSFKPEGARVVFNKKLLKDDQNHNDNLPENRISFAAYDEYRTGKQNIIYGQVTGADHYFTFVVPNDFSVYKMNRFDVAIDPESIEIIK